MPARDPFSQSDLPNVYGALGNFSARDRALIILGLHTGFRARELGAMTIGHVVAEDGAIRTTLALERRHLKHGRGVYCKKIGTRTVPLAPNARAALEHYITERRAAGTAEPDAPLFRSLKGGGLSPWQINRIVHKIAIAAGCDPNRFYGSHSLRMTFAHAVHRACGRDLTVTRVALGHSSVLVSQSYLRVDREQSDAAILAIGPSMVAA
jgi:integrase